MVLDRYCRSRPDDSCALHLFGLVCESLGQRELAADYIGRAIAILEAEYEETEDSTVERHFTIANSNLARLRLALKDYEGALESFESALGLLAEDVKEDKIDVMRAQAQFGMGLANFKLGDLETALGLFEAALETAGENTVVHGHVTVLLAQTMWAIGTEEFKESAKAQLLDCIAADSENLAAINALAGMGILTDDEGLVDAALADLLALPLDRRLELDPQRDVNYLLTKHHIGQVCRLKYRVFCLFNYWLGKPGKGVGRGTERGPRRTQPLGCSQSACNSKHPARQPHVGPRPPVHFQPRFRHAGHGARIPSTAGRD
jgi:superkiller protein 3